MFPASNALCRMVSEFFNFDFSAVCFEFHSACLIRNRKDIALMNMASLLFRGDYPTDAIVATNIALEISGNLAPIHVLRGFIFAVGDVLSVWLDGVWFFFLVNFKVWKICGGVSGGCQIRKPKKSDGKIQLCDQVSRKGSPGIVRSTWVRKDLMTSVAQ